MRKTAGAGEARAGRSCLEGNAVLGALGRLAGAAEQR